MLTPSSRRIICLLFYLFFRIEGVLGRGWGGGGGEIEHANDGADAGVGLGFDLGLPPDLVAVFSVTIAIGILTGYQLISSLGRFERLRLPEGESMVPYDVGMLFRVLLSSYTAMFLADNVLYAVYIASFGDTLVLPSKFKFAVWVPGQISNILFYATFLSIIAHRQRIQLNSGENLVKLKSFVDGLLLATMLGVGVANVYILGHLKSARDLKTASKLSFGYQILLLIASVDVAASSLVAYARLSKAKLKDTIISIAAFAVGPIVLIGGIYEVVEVVIIRHAGPSFDFDILLIVTVTMEGVVSFAAIACCLLMGAPPKKTKAGGGGENARN